MENDEKRLLRAMVVDDQKIAAGLASNIFTAEPDIDVSRLVEASQAMQEEQQNAAGGSERIQAAQDDPAPQRMLLVEDNADLLDLAVMMMEELGYEATGVTTAEDALALLEKHAYAMLVTDVTLPKMSGNELVALVRSRYPQMPVVVASGYGRSPALAEHDVRYLKKPYKLSDLQQAIAQGLQQKTAA